MNKNRLYFLHVSYDGTHFNGSQIQGNLPTIQGILNVKLSMLLRRPIETYGASRTDEGVHARMNMYHFEMEPCEIMYDLKYKLNSVLPPHLAVVELYSADDLTKNCRFDALSRQYRYKIHAHKDPFLHNRSYFYPYKLDFEALNSSAKIIMEFTDFSTFAKKNSQTFTHNCQIFNSYWDETSDGLEYVVEANRFLRGMVRALVGTQLHVGRGKCTIDQFRNKIESKNSQEADFSVPGHGLYLENIKYPNGYFDEKL